MTPQPSWRKPAGMLLILLIIAIWGGLVASLSPWIGRLPTLAQAVVYVVTGIVWILPMRPLLIWMETGRWRA
jgi:predicted membrane channel-forming protein YqfA (hemolysin III family)